MIEIACNSKELRAVFFFFTVSGKSSKELINGECFNVIYSTFANGEVKEFKEVREVKAICFTTIFTTQKAIGYNF